MTWIQTIIFHWKPADATARTGLTIAAWEVGKLSLQLDDNSVWAAIAAGTGAGMWARPVPPASVSLEGTMAAADFAKLGGVEAGAQVCSAAHVQTACAALASSLAVNSRQITSLADGTAASDAAAFGQVLRKSPIGGFQFVEDFLGALSASFVATTFSYTTQNWVGSTSNTGTMAAGVGSATEIGVITQGTGTNTAGAHFVTAWQSGPKGVAFVHSSAHAFEYGFKVASSTAVSDGTNTYACNVGVNNASAYAATLGVGFYVRWDANADTHFLFCTADGAGETVVATTTVVAGTGYHKIVFTKAAGSTAVHCLIDGVDVGSTGTLPTSAAIGPGMLIVKTAGATARTLDTDWVYADYQIPGGR